MSVPAESPTFSKLDTVEKIGGDYTFEGVVVSRFQKRSGAWRYVVEDERGILMIYSGKNLRMLVRRAKP